MAAMHASTTLLRWMTLVLVGLAPLACERQAPSPWREMKFPLRHGEVLSGASAGRLSVLYRNTKRRSDLFREFSRALKRSGFEHVRDGKDHDPAADTHSGVFKKGDSQIRLVVVAAPGGANAEVHLTRID